MTDIEKSTSVDNQTEIAPEQELSIAATILNPNSWSRTEYFFLTGGILIQALLYSFESNVMYNCLGNVTAIFKQTSLTSILPTILQILSAALVPFYTKVSDVTGRAQALTFAMVFYLIGYTIQGTSNAFLQFAIGQIFYGIGATGMQILTQVLIADTTLLINRGIVFALWDLPSIAMVFATNPLTDRLSNPLSPSYSTWRNVYLLIGLVALAGAVAILTPLWHLQKKGERTLKTQGKVVPKRTLGWLLHEFDTVGAILITGGMSLTLLPMILARTFEGNWNNGKIIAMFVIGVILLILLVIWEVRFTSRPIMSMRIWSNRTAFGGLAIVFLMTVMAGMNWQYYTVYLVISRDLTFSRALLLERGYQVAYTVLQLITAFAMKRFNTLRPFIWTGIVIYAIGLGLMIPARLPTSSDFFIVISQTIVGIGGGMTFIATSVAITGVVAKKDIATVIGASQLMGAFGGAFGAALSGGIWTQYLPGRLAKHITGPYDESGAMNDIFTYILTLDATTKSQVIDAYADAQKLMSIIACAMAVLACICAFMMQHVNLKMDQEEQDARAAGTHIEFSEDSKQEVAKKTNN
ncbi:hypothetical protein BGZ94_009573 [Podila epigama]|nr:hypothetical protein BGZ94_009573 [Podila epigama]